MKYWTSTAWLAALPSAAVTSSVEKIKGEAGCLFTKKFIIRVSLHNMSWLFPYSWPRETTGRWKIVSYRTGHIWDGRHKTLRL